MEKFKKYSWIALKYSWYILFCILMVTSVVDSFGQVSLVTTIVLTLTTFFSTWVVWNMLFYDYDWKFISKDEDGNDKVMFSLSRK